MIVLKKIYAKLFFVSILATMAVGCVDEYYEANPPRLLDAPFIHSVTVSEDTITDNSSTQITANIVDAPGVIDSIAVSVVDELNQPFGTVEVVEDPSGSTSGNLVIRYTAPENRGGLATVCLEVFDKQRNHLGELSRKGSGQKCEDIFVFCPSNLAGTYNTIASGDYGDGEGGSAGTYSDLESTVTFTDLGAGVYQVDDITFGLYPVAYGDNAPAGKVTDECKTIKGDPNNKDQYNDPITINGQVNADGTLNITWSNTYGDTGDVVLTPQ